MFLAVLAGSVGHGPQAEEERLEENAEVGLVGAYIRREGRGNRIWNIISASASRVPDSGKRSNATRAKTTLFSFSPLFQKTKLREDAGWMLRCCAQMKRKKVMSSEDRGEGNVSKNSYSCPPIVLDSRNPIVPRTRVIHAD